jgi:DNA-binding transcriptional regulator YiaG
LAQTVKRAKLDGMRFNEAQALARVRDLARAGHARSVRMAAGLSQPEVASVVGVTASCISRWEHGQRRPTGAAGIKYALLIESLRDLVRSR